MKKVFFIFSIVFAAMAFNVLPSTEYMAISGKITNPVSDSLIVRSRSIYKKIHVNKDGSFADTLKVVPGYYQLTDGNEAADLYLTNGFSLELTLDTKAFDASLAFKGNGAEPNTYLAAKNLLLGTFFEEDALYVLDKAAFDAKMNQGNKRLTAELAKVKTADVKFIEREKKEVSGIIESYKESYADNHFLKTVLIKGVQSPVFINYENYKGGQTSLADLKGKYVYLDIWATWCGPCKGEIPFLKEVEKTYHSKNIEFVSISVDELRDHDKWAKMVKENELTGIQLFSDKNWESEFVKDYKISGIPRFILIDPSGKIVSAEAPRPSAPELKVLLDQLLN